MSFRRRHDDLAEQKFDTSNGGSIITTIVKRHDGLIMIN